MEVHMLAQQQYWNAVVERDSAFDGQFVYAVKSTGIFCKPSCTSRKPKRISVEFYPLPAAAEQAGYRACKRCKPDQQDLIDPQAELVQAMCGYLAELVSNPPTLDQLGEHFNYSPTYLQKVFKDLMGISPLQYVDALRLAHFKSTLRDGTPITDAIYEAGYGSSSRLYERTDSHIGMQPSTYQKGGKGTMITYILADSHILGYLLVAATSKGVCFVSLGDEPQTLVDELHAEFPKASITPDEDGTLTEAVQTILNYLNGWEPHLDLTLDVRATAFQELVWAELRRIPYGETRTYTQVANALDKPNAVRAVARACATNPVSLIIPCHRVVRKDGSLAGYRWGLGRKEQLQSLEKEHKEELQHA